MTQTGFGVVDARAGGFVRPEVVLYRAEWALVAVVLGLLALTFAFDALRPAQVIWSGYLVPIAASLMLVALGGFIRARRPMKRVAAFATGLGIFMAFSAVAGVFIYLIFPFSGPTIDPFLIRVDAALGYDWAALVIWLAGWPLLGQALALIYMTSIPQLVLVIAVLAWTTRITEMHRFLAVGILGMIVTVAVWWVFPSVGPTPFVAIPAEGALIGLVVGQAYADALMHLVTVGPGVIRADQTVGVIAFPSFHMFMACMTVWFSRRTPLFWGALGVNLLMVPATLSHGGHHLVDLIASVALFAAVVALCARLVPEQGADLRCP